MTYDASISQLNLMALFDLQGARDSLEQWCGPALPDFPDSPLTYASREKQRLMWLGQEHWILSAPLEEEESLTEQLKPSIAPDDISIVRISDTISFFAITGQEADEVMAVATPMDVHPDAFAEHGSAYTEAFGIKALVIRTKDGFHLGVDRSYGSLAADYLTRITAD